ncbi:MAG TPA: hypothetical protein DCF84_00170 [Bacteroidetes bacterium]|nr:hypothetical protein [Bacteroidota bacterium]
MRNVVFLFLIVLGTTSWAQFDDVYSSSPWDYEEEEALIYTASDESYNTSIHDATVYSDIDFYNDEYWMYDDYDFKYSRNINRFYKPIYGTTYYDFRYTNGFYYTYNPWDWGVNIYVNTTPWRPRRWGWNTGWNNAWYGGGFGPTYSVTTYGGWVSPWPSMHNSWHTSWGYGGLGWNNTWLGGYSNWYGHQYWAYNNPLCSGFGFNYNDWYADAGNVHYGPRLGGKSYGNRDKNKSFVMQEDGFDNPRTRAQGISLSSTTSGTTATQADDNKMSSYSSNSGVTRYDNQTLNTSRSEGQASMYNRSSESNTTSKNEDNASIQGVNQQATFQGNIQSHDNTQRHHNTGNVNSGYSNTDRNTNHLQDDQFSRGNKAGNNSNVQRNQDQQPSQGNGSLSNSRRSNAGKSSSGNNRSNQSNLNRSNGGSRGSIGNGGSMNNGGGNNRSNGDGSSNPRSRGGGR